MRAETPAAVQLQCTAGPRHCPLPPRCPRRSGWLGRHRSQRRHARDDGATRVVAHQAQNRGPGVRGAGFLDLPEGRASATLSRMTRPAIIRTALKRNGIRRSQTRNWLPVSAETAETMTAAGQVRRRWRRRRQSRVVPPVNVRPPSALPRPTRRRQRCPAQRAAARGPAGRGTGLGRGGQYADRGGGRSHQHHGKHQQAFASEAVAEGVENSPPSGRTRNRLPAW